MRHIIGGGELTLGQRVKSLRRPSPNPKGMLKVSISSTLDKKYSSNLSRKIVVNFSGSGQSNLTGYLRQISEEIRLKKALPLFKAETC